MQEDKIRPIFQEVIVHSEQASLRESINRHLIRRLKQGLVTIKVSNIKSIRLHRREATARIARRGSVFEFPEREDHSGPKLPAQCACQPCQLPLREKLTLLVLPHKHL